jgi:DNA-binding NarL/FixJ family response regulator
MQNKILKILIADDHELFRKGIISLLISEEKIKIIGEANNGSDLVYKYFKLKPDIVITDISMPEVSGIEAVRILFEKDNNIKVIFLSMYGGEDYIYHCLKSGGLGLINKNVPREELLVAIYKVSRGEKYFGKDFSDEKIERLIEDYEKHLETSDLNGSAELTDKEIEVLLLVANGLTSNEIADKLFISKRTVDTHRTHLMQKLDLKSFPQLMKYAILYADSLKKDSLEE